MAELPAAAVVVRNTARHDARVLRCATTLRSLGYAVVVVAVASEEETTTHSSLDGIPIVRLTPRAPLTGAAQALRRVRARWRRPRAGAAGYGRWRGADLGAGEKSRLGPLRRAYRLMRTLDYYRQGVGTMRRLRPAIVHCNDYNTMWIGVGAKLLAGSALVYDSHELWPDRNGRSEPRRWLLLCEALFVRLADCNLATSPGHAETISRRHRIEPPRLVRNIPERRLSAPGDNGLPSNDGAERSIAYVGAVTAGRGLEQAISALPAAPRIVLRILGPGAPSYRDGLSGLARQLGVAERVRFEDPVSPRGVASAIAGAGAGLALIQPCCLSYELSLPNKLFEYVAAGLPILAADLPTIRAFVEGTGAGLVVAPQSPAAIAAAMRQILDPEGNRLLRKAVAEAAAELSWEREEKHLETAYREATAAAGGQ